MVFILIFGFSMEKHEKQDLQKTFSSFSSLILCFKHSFEMSFAQLDAKTGSLAVFTSFRR